MLSVSVSAQFSNVPSFPQVSISLEDLLAPGNAVCEGEFNVTPAEVTEEDKAAALAGNVFRMPILCARTHSLCLRASREGGKGSGEGQGRWKTRW